MDTSRINRLYELDQYSRFESIQKNLSALKGQDVEKIIQLAQESSESGAIDSAIEISDLAVLCAIALDDDLLLAKACTVRAKILFAAGDNRAAIQYSLQALNTLLRFERSFDDIRRFFLEFNFEFAVALVDARTASDLESAAAIELLNQVGGIFSVHEYQIGVGYVHNAKGDVYKDAYQLEDAYISYKHALEILRKYGIHVAELLLNLSYVCGHLNQFPENALYLDEAERIYREEENEFGLATVDISRAVILRNKRQYRNIVRYYRRAHEVFAAQNLVPDAAFIEMNVATLLLFYPAHQLQSMSFLKSAISTFEEFSNKRLATKARIYLAIVHYTHAEYKQSKELLLSIMDSHRSDVPTDVLWKVYYFLGNLERLDGKVAKAYEYYQSAVGIIETTRSYLRTDELQIDILDDKIGVYDPLVSLANELGRPVVALEWAEYSKSRAFLHILGNTKIDNQSDVTGGLVEQIDEIDSQIDILERTINTNESKELPKTISTWRQNMSMLNARREQLRREKKIRNAERASINEIHPSGFEEIQAILSI